MAALALRFAVDCVSPSATVCAVVDSEGDVPSANAPEPVDRNIAAAMASASSRLIF